MAIVVSNYLLKAVQKSFIQGTIETNLHRFISVKKNTDELFTAMNHHQVLYILHNPNTMKHPIFVSLPPHLIEISGVKPIAATPRLTQYLVYFVSHSKSEVDRYLPNPRGKFAN